MSRALCWLRRDLRLHDHHALSVATQNHENVDLVFVFDQHILGLLPSKQDKRLTFIYESLVELEKELQKKGSSLHIKFGKPEEEIPKLAESLKVTGVYSNRDYEPYAKKRDETVSKKLKSLGIEFIQFKDAVQFERHEILTGNGSIYKVFTPYKNKWLEVFSSQGGQTNEYEVKSKSLAKWENKKSILEFNWYKEIGFEEDKCLLPAGSKHALKRLKEFKERISHYAEARNFPTIEGTSNLSPYIRHGNLSIRDMIRLSRESQSEGAQTWLSELIWRDFYQVILDTHPYVLKESFKREYDKIRWPGQEKDFKAWCEGQTGFPIVDAAMRCFNETGMMHNRLRMIVASFLCKILLVDWRKGEKYFADKLLDFDLAANNGGWQWSSSSGCDAQPYFRIFNPYTQSEKFDADGVFIKEWVPELRGLTSKTIHNPHKSKTFVQGYPEPVVNYEAQRVRALEVYKVVKSEK